MIFDTHAHYDDDAFDEDRDTLLGEIFSSGICCITDVGASVKSSKSAGVLSKKWPQIYAAVGVHPDSTADMTEEDIETLRSLAQEKKVVAIARKNAHAKEPTSRNPTTKCSSVTTLV